MVGIGDRVFDKWKGESNWMGVLGWGGIMKGRDLVVEEKGMRKEDGVGSVEMIEEM